MGFGSALSVLVEFKGSNKHSALLQHSPGFMDASWESVGFQNQFDQFYSSIVTLISQINSVKLIRLSFPKLQFLDVEETLGELKM